MYPPTHHQDYNDENIKSVAVAYPFATLISAKEKTPYVTHAPLIFHGDKLVGHIDANNPHITLLKDNYPITAVFQGPQTYISPSIYTTNQLPTWNYIIAHATGVVTEIKNPEIIKKSMVTMTEFLEAPDQDFKLSLEDPRMDRLVPYIHCFEIDIQQWEGKFKLSQDKVPADIENAKQELIKNNQKSVTDFVNTLFEKHF
ncbi:FMN-binding negative transcriptional regulator [Aquimarina sp. 2201CG14-23]|uniref:FMN-binding negative transcriptional regulator n=1 Tax=Aquimarina mycalae TaxID=3040073 RepID=UPI0024780076|nr:FMN-binding negative transcriptional regulator [Aquimarina sp. 2201CG14-23]MDH7444794.1 FMN-binding negative transcriptional regulator [Aquimarina sp. 2201CG14-23]